MLVSQPPESTYRCPLPRAGERLKIKYQKQYQVPRCHDHRRHASFAHHGFIIAEAGAVPVQYRARL
ncbi:MAG: hypothetical protein Q8M95_08555 [Candidatus Methanoperedens sp.]|nr:hypothetical protein [Candidatus Methanoperedens sp.]